MGKFRKIPVVIEAWKWEGNNLHDAMHFSKSNGLPQWNVGKHESMTGLIIPTLEGSHVAQKGDFIIRGVQGEYYPCKPDIFKKTYEKAD